MFEKSISKDIWALKYRYNDEEESDFYARPAKGLFSDMTDKELKPYLKIVGVRSREDFYGYLTECFTTHSCMLAGRPMYSLGTGKTQQTYSNCYVVPIKKDSMQGIMDAVSDSAMTMRSGGGVGYNFSILRPKKAIISTSGAASTGVLSFMRIFNTTCGSIAAGGNRRGAQIGILGIWHPDIEDFIVCKRGMEDIPDDLKPYKNFNLSVYISDDFIEAVKADAPWNLIFPDTKFEKYDEEWDGNMKAWREKGYPVIVHKTLPARELWDAIMQSNYDFAEPGILFEDTINRMNTLWMVEYIMACNPCGEQPLVANGSCNLGSLNLTQYVINAFSKDATFNLDRLEKVVRNMVIMMDRMLDINYYPLDAQAEVVKRKRQIGLGITGLGDMLAMMTLKYSSDEAHILAHMVMGRLRNSAFRASVELAKELGLFPLWNEMTEEQKDQFVEGPYISTLPEEIKADIRKYGIRNSRLLSIAPTGTISLIMNNVSSGAEPIYLLEYERKVKRSNEETTTEVVECYSWGKYKEFTGQENPEKPDYFETTADLSVDAHIQMQSILQQYICTAISKTINIPVEYDYDSFKEVYMNAHAKGIKGCTTYRPNDVVGSVLSEKGEKTTLCGEDRRPKTINHTCAPKRPEALSCNIHHCTVKGVPWLVIIGMLGDYPYEVFAGESEELYVPKSCKTGNVIKKRGGKYSLEISIRNSLVEYKDLAHVLMTTEQRAVTRLLSLAMRHGTPLEFIQEQLRKVNGDITDFSAVVARVLSSYIKEYKYTKATKCPECGDDLIREEGCFKCTCGYSRCG